MYKLIIYFFCSFFIILNSNSDEEKQFLMLKNNKVNVRYGPSFEYPIKYIYKKIQLPVQLIDKKENFRRIMDHKKNSGWIHRIMLTKLNSLIILEEKIVFKKNTRFSKPIVKLEKGRLVLIKKCKLDWCKIETENYSGWIETKNVWGI